MFTRRPPPTFPDTQPQHAPEPDKPHQETTVHDLPLPELKAFHEHIGAILAQRTAEAREDFRQDFLAKLTLYGMSFDDFKPVPQKKERKPREVKIRFRDPTNPENVWTGIGKPKKWLQERLDAGASLDDFRVPEGDIIYTL